MWWCVCCSSCVFFSVQRTESGHDNCLGIWKSEAIHPYSSGLFFNRYLLYPVPFIIRWPISRSSVPDHGCSKHRRKRILFCLPVRRCLVADIDIHPIVRHHSYSFDIYCTHRICVKWSILTYDLFDNNSDGVSGRWRVSEIVLSLKLSCKAWSSRGESLNPLLMLLPFLFVVIHTS